MFSLQAPRLRSPFAPAVTLTLPDYTGSLRHGAFGHALREVICGLGTWECGNCPHSAVSTLSFFDKVPERTGQPRHAAPLHPYFIESVPKRSAVETGEPFEWGLALIGKLLPWLALGWSANAMPEPFSSKYQYSE